MASLNFLHHPFLPASLHHRFLTELGDREVFGTHDIGQPSLELLINPCWWGGWRFEREGSMRFQIGGIGSSQGWLKVSGENGDRVSGHGKARSRLVAGKPVSHIYISDRKNRKNHVIFFHPVWQGASHTIGDTRSFC